MPESFEHFISYGSTDQQTVRDLADYFDGLLVPGTIAAFQAEGTKGFVLSHSARSNDPYMIDSRFPLFQNQLRNPKKSHALLADVLGVPGLVNTEGRPTPQDFSSDMLTTVAHRWLDFNLGYENVQSKTFAKYAARLKIQVLPQDRRAPSSILPPYTMVKDLNDGWAEISEQIWNASLQEARTRMTSIPLRRVVAAESADVWGDYAAAISDKDLIAWVDNLDEFRPDSAEALTQYGAAIRSATQRGQRVFALYGGFFSVLLARYGLKGSSHGIGFGEHRSHIELPSSGAPPARYYIPKLHRYASVEVAQSLWTQFPELVACRCVECGGSSPLSLDYHALMRHSVRVRNLEIQEWTTLSTPEAVERLTQDFESFRHAVRALDAPGKVIQRAEGLYPHLSMWARVLSELG